MSSSITAKIWNNYYLREEPNQIYPDENLVRAITPLVKKNPNLLGCALDLGCGGGRHIALLHTLGFKKIYASDLSSVALKTCLKKYSFIHPLDISEDFWEKGNVELGIPSTTLDIVLAWGVLHYNTFEEIQVMLKEIKRTLKKENSYFIGTLRADTDTHLKKNTQLKDTNTQNWLYFNVNSAKDLLNPLFSEVQLGYIERSPLGKIEERICHLFFVART